MCRLIRIIGRYVECNHSTRPNAFISQPAFTWSSLTATTARRSALHFCPSSLGYKTRHGRQQQQVAAIHIKRVSSLENSPRRTSKYYAPDELSDDTPLSKFRRALEANNINSIASAYAGMDLSDLRPRDARNLASVLSYHQRLFHGRNYAKAKREEVKTRMELVRQLLARMISDLKAGRLAPDPMASLHILAFFRDAQDHEAGRKFWAWLREQDRSCTDARTYGSAIEMLTWAGAPLSELEALYQEALTIDPGQFSEYHLSPNAIVVNKNVYAPLAGVRLLLLQGILTARVNRGDWRNAYLALDTALRLGLDLVPRRIFEALIYQRPLSEAWKIFMLACQTGVRLATKTLTILLGRLGKCQSLQSHPSKNIAIAEAGVAAIQAHDAVRGELTGHHLTGLVALLLKSLHYLPQKSPPRPETETMTETLEDQIRLCIDLFRSRTLQPLPSLFRMMIVRAAKLKMPGLVGFAASELGRSSLHPEVVTLTLLLEAGGELGMIKVIEESWEGIVKADEESIKTGNPPIVGVTAWLALVKACVQTGHKDYLESQLSKLSSTLNTRSATKIRSYMSNVEGQTPKAPAAQIGTPVESGLDGPVTGLLQRLKTFQHSMRSVEANDFFRSPVEMNLLWTSVPLPDEVRSLYDQVTTDPHLQSSTEESKDTLALSPIQFPLADLRFVAWKTVSELLIEAEINEETRVAAEQGHLKVDTSTMRLISSPGLLSSPVEADDMTEDDFEDTRDPSATGISRDPRRTPADWPKEAISSTILRLRGIKLPKPA